MNHRYFYILIIALNFTLVTACSSQGVKPWQKRDLAKPEMQFNSSPVEASFEEHFYFSKEGSSGGKSFSGGGCGCN